MDNLREVYATEGPQCPVCHCQITADEPGYYDESNYRAEECPSCGITYDVSVCIETTWTCTERLSA